jgi:hypothetical protein
MKNQFTYQFSICRKMLHISKYAHSLTRYRLTLVKDVCIVSIDSRFSKTSTASDSIFFYQQTILIYLTMQ